MHVLVGVEGPAEGGEQGGGKAQHGGGPGGAGPSRHRDRSAHSIHKLFDRAGQSDVKITASQSYNVNDFSFGTMYIFHLVSFYH